MVSGELYDKRVGIISAAPSTDRGTNAREMLERTLRAQGAIVTESRTIAIAPSERDRLPPAAKQSLGEVLARLTSAIVAVGGE